MKKKLYIYHTFSNEMFAKNFFSYFEHNKSYNIGTSIHYYIEVCIIKS